MDSLSNAELTEQPFLTPQQQLLWWERLHTQRALFGSTAAAAAGHHPQTSASNASDVMNQLCRVCGEPAAGFHFGAFTCEGCKSFFGRTYNNLSSISECKNSGQCVINKKNRTSCKACRLRKCLVVGMSKSGSRYGRRSNWFKIHCLLQEQSNNNNTIPQASPSPNMLSESSKALHKQPSNNNENSSSSWSPSLLPHHKKIVSPDSPPPAMPPQRSLGPSSLLPGYAANSEASLAALTAAAFWASRNNTLLPPDLLSPHNQTSLSPFFAAAASPFANKSFLFPFHPSSPKHHHPSAPHLSTSTTHSPPPSSPASSASSQASSQASCCPSPKPKEEEVAPPGHLSGLALLRTLGPVQDSPMDLSVGAPPLPRTRREPPSVMEEREENESREGRKRRRSDSRGRASPEEERERPAKPPTPLDLTTKI